jgi:hypothetical protein
MKGVAADQLRVAGNSMIPVTKVLNAEAGKTGDWQKG